MQINVNVDAYILTKTWNHLPSKWRTSKIYKQYLALCEFKSFVKLVARRFSSIDFLLYVDICM